VLNDHSRWLYGLLRRLDYSKWVLYGVCNLSVSDGSGAWYGWSFEQSIVDIIYDTSGQILAVRVFKPPYFLLLIKCYFYLHVLSDPCLIVMEY